jgi:Protein of unknown function (DUF3592)
VSRSVFVALSLVFAGVGAVLALHAARGLVRRRAFLAQSVLAEGRVVGFRRQREGGSERDSFFPQIEFHTQAGHPVRFESETGSESPSLCVGDVVRVRYRADAPNEAELDEIFTLWGLPLLLGALGAIFSAVGVSLLAGWIVP